MGESLAKSKTDGDPAPEPRANNTGLDPHVLAVMLLFFNLQRTAALQLKLLSRDRRLSERGLLILALVNAGHDQPAKLLKIMDILPSTSFKVQEFSLKQLVNIHERFFLGTF